MGKLMFTGRDIKREVERLKLYLRAPVAVWIEGRDFFAFCFGDETEKHSMAGADSKISGRTGSAIINRKTGKWTFTQSHIPIVNVSHIPDYARETVDVTFDEVRRAAEEDVLESLRPVEEADIDRMLDEIQKLPPKQRKEKYEELKRMTQSNLNFGEVPMKPTIHDFGRILGSVLIYLALVSWFGLLPNTCLLAGVPVAAWLFPLFNFGGEIEQAKAKGKWSLDNLFDTIAALAGFPIALLDVKEDGMALVVTIVVFGAIILLWKYREPKGV